MKSVPAFALLLAALCPCLALAQPAATQPSSAPFTLPPAPPLDLASLPQPDNSWCTFTTYVDNDSGYIKPDHGTDRYYTSGLALTFSHHPQWAYDLAALLPAAGCFDQVGVGYEAGQLMFTPSVYDQTSLPQYGDRPYAGFLYAGGYLDRANDLTMQRFQLDVGMVGRDSLAETTQESWHRTIGVDKPLGWHNQMPDEGEVQAYFRQKWRLDFGPDNPTPSDLVFQVIPQFGLAAGSVYRFAEVGTIFRYGFNLPDDFGPGRIADPAAASANRDNHRWTGSLFAGALVRGVEHDLFLQGDTWRNSPVTVTPEPAVGEARAGFTLGRHGNCLDLDLTYMQTFQTREFTTQHGTHAWASILVAFTWHF